ncbi:MAG: polyphosphate kinase 1 [Armatimonadetes bacterium]|nr:polyphosphate kinase 1 [Armatimonadota bacterium]
MDLRDPALYTNRELTWLQFNQRVLHEALDERNPLLERLKFLAIVSSNLDEFFMVRVAGVQQQVAAGVTSPKQDGIPPRELLERLRDGCHAQIEEQYRVYRESVEPRLRQAGVRVLRPADLNAEQEQAAERFFTREVFPVLSPLAIDPGHPLPHLGNLSLNLVVTLRQPWVAGAAPLMAVVEVPDVLARLVPLPSADGQRDFILLEDVIAPRVHKLFTGFQVLSCSAFRITRNSDLNLDEEEAEDLLRAIEQELRERERGNPVRLEITAHHDEAALAFLLRELGIAQRDVYVIDGPLNLKHFFALAGLPGFDSLRFRPFVPPIVPALRESDEDIFSRIRRGDILLHHPYESFSSVVDFVEQAAQDPDVLAVKMTLYRTSGDSPIVRALMLAAQNGKQVGALVELKARFDEGANINWARQLEEAGVHVVYGLLGLKTHCKVLCVVRRERDGLRRYVHLGTGNYHPSTAKLYTDLGLLTADEAIGEDVTELFNILTGYSDFPTWRKLAVAPRDMKKRVLAMIEREAALSTPQRPGRIIAKLNSIIEPNVIRALYQASQAGVQIDLICRGICGLVPGVPGVSETIRVRSIVGRFLEHTRVYYFGNGGNPEVYLASADWMDRNLDRRIETMFPIQDPALRDRIINEILALHLADNVKARELRSDGTWTRVPRDSDEPEVNSQEEFIRLALAQAPLGEAKLGTGARFLLQRLGRGEATHAEDAA